MESAQLKGMVVLFDGECQLCNGAVRFIIPRDPQARISFAALQSEAAQVLLIQSGVRAETLPDSLIVWEQGRIYSKSAAALRIVRRLYRGWPLLYSAWLIPRFIRDGLYDYVARNRYRWFGKQTNCLMPTAAVRSRFLPGGLL